MIPAPPPPKGAVLAVADEVFAAWDRLDGAVRSVEIANVSDLWSRIVEMGHARSAAKTLFREALRRPRPATPAEAIPQACEFCGSAPVLYALEDHPVWTAACSREHKPERYTVCANCLAALTTRSLAPWQFLHARDHGGDIRRHLLHDDFYHPETGVALQPMVPGLTKMPVAITKRLTS